VTKVEAFLVFESSLREVSLAEPMHGWQAMPVRPSAGPASHAASSST
jgi:hypothetical protein